MKDAPRTIENPPALKINATLYRSTSMPLHVRVEQRIVWNLLKHLAAEGWMPVCVISDGEVKALTAVDVMEEVFSLDAAAWVRFRKTGCVHTHDVFLVLGNETTITSDWTLVKGDADGFDAVMRNFDAEVFA